MFGSFSASVMPAYACGKMKSLSPETSEAISVSLSALRDHDDLVDLSALVVPVRVVRRQDQLVEAPRVDLVRRGRERDVVGQVGRNVVAVVEGVSLDQAGEQVLVRGVDLGELGDDLLSSLPCSSDMILS